MFTWLEGVVAGILAGTCGYSGTIVSPSNAAIFLGVNQGLYCKNLSVTLSLGLHFELLDNCLVSLVLHTEPLDDLHVQCGVLEDHVLHAEPC